MYYLKVIVLLFSINNYNFALSVLHQLQISRTILKIYTYCFSFYLSIKKRQVRLLRFLTFILILLCKIVTTGITANIWKLRLTFIKVQVFSIIKLTDNSKKV